jgi:hypothetical protein
MEYEDEVFMIGDDVVRVLTIENYQILPEVRGKITNVNLAGVTIVVSGLPFFLAKDSFGEDWLHYFDYHHLVCTIASIYPNRAHMQMLFESWGERLVLAAAQKVSPLVLMKVLDLCVKD